MKFNYRKIALLSFVYFTFCNDLYASEEIEAEKLLSEMSKIIERIQKKTAHLTREELVSLDNANSIIAKVDLSLSIRTLSTSSSKSPMAREEENLPTPQNKKEDSPQTLHATQSMNWEEQWDQLRSTPQGEALEISLDYLPTCGNTLYGFIAYGKGELSNYVQIFNKILRSNDSYPPMTSEDKQKLVKELAQHAESNAVKNWDFYNSTTGHTLQLIKSLGITVNDLKKDKELAMKLNRHCSLIYNKNTREASKLEEIIKQSFTK